MLLSPLLWRSLVLLLGLMSLVSFFLMGADKRRAKRGAWRIPERTLWLFALLWGAVGGTLGMLHYRHKTKHPSFRYGFPLMALAQLGVTLWLGAAVLS